jgi:hypothetical protein
MVTSHTFWPFSQISPSAANAKEYVFIFNGSIVFLLTVKL